MIYLAALVAGLVPITDEAILLIAIVACPALLALLAGAVRMAVMGGGRVPAKSPFPPTRRRRR